jgi:hypothetical protein
LAGSAATSTGSTLESLATEERDQLGQRCHSEHIDVLDKPRFFGLAQRHDDPAKTASANATVAGRMPRTAAPGRRGQPPSSTVDQPIAGAASAARGSQRRCPGRNTPRWAGQGQAS